MVHFTTSRPKRKAFLFTFFFFSVIIGKKRGVAARKKGRIMPQDAFTLRLVAKELDSALAGGHINKIIQPSPDEVDLVVFTAERRTRLLVLSTNASECGAYFEDRAAEAPPVCPNFCMLLRKYIQGAEILSVAPVGVERILAFRLREKTEFTDTVRLLLLEVMGKYSNLMLTEGAGLGTILGALKTTSIDGNTHRVIFPGVAYALSAPQAEKVSLAEENRAELRRVLALASGDLGQFLFTRVAGLAPATAQQIAENYRGGDLEEFVRSFVFSDDISPCVLEKDGMPVDFYARPVAGALPFPTLSAAQSYCYGKKRARRSFEGKRRKYASAVATALKKQEKRLAQILEKQKECADCELLRKKGEILTANLYALHKGMEGCTLPDYYDGGDLRIALDPMRTPAENAQSYFKRYRKQRRTLEMLAPQETETRDGLEYLRTLAAAAERAETEEDLLSLEEELTAAELIRSAPQKRGKNRPEIPYPPTNAAGSASSRGATTCRTTVSCALPPPRTSGCTHSATTPAMSSSAPRASPSRRKFCNTPRTSARAIPTPAASASPSTARRSGT